MKSLSIVVAEPALPPRSPGCGTQIILALVAYAGTLFFAHSTELVRARDVLFQGTQQSKLEHKLMVLEQLTDSSKPGVGDLLVDLLEVLPTHEAYKKRKAKGRALELMEPIFKARKPDLSPAALNSLCHLIAEHQSQRAYAICQVYGVDLELVIREGLSDSKTRLTRLALLASFALLGAEDVPAVLEAVKAQDLPLTDKNMAALALNLPIARNLKAKAEDRLEYAWLRQGLSFVDAELQAKLLSAYQDTRSPLLVRVLAPVLYDLDRPAFLKALDQKIEESQKGGQVLMRARASLLKQSTFGSGLMTLKERERLRAVVAGHYRLASCLEESLRALEGRGASDAVDFSLMRSLSSLDERVARLSALLLRKRMKRARFIDTLFQFLARKASFEERELVIYESALVGYKSSASEDIARNLTTLLDSARGRPEAVFWVHKVLAFRALKRVGTRSAMAILQKYQRDSSTYIKVQRHPRLPGKTQNLSLRFADLAQQALSAIEKRSPRG